MAFLEAVLVDKDSGKFFTAFSSSALLIAPACRDQSELPYQDGSLAIPLLTDFGFY